MKPILHLPCHRVYSFMVRKLNPAERPEEFLHSPLESGSLGTLLLDFFNYYGSTFPYEDFYISVTEGKLLPKESADWINTKHPGRLAVQCLVNPGQCYSSSSTSTTAPRAHGAMLQRMTWLEQLRRSNKSKLYSDQRTKLSPSSHLRLHSQIS